MGALKSLLYLFLLWWMPAESYTYNTDRYICETPAGEDVCHYSDNPNLMHIIQSRYGGSESVQLPTEVLVEENPMASRQGLYFDDQQADNVMKHINFGYLNLNQPISCMGDLIDMESEEIGSHYIPKRKPPAMTAWKMDDVKTLLAAPKVLPDIMLNDEEDAPAKSHRKNHFLDEEDEKLGRFVVDDCPAEVPDIIQTEDSELTQETQDICQSEVGEKYHYDPARYYSKAPTLVIDKVMPRKEKQQNFMEELYKIKQALALAHEEAEALDREEAIALAQAEAQGGISPIPGSGEVIEEVIPEYVPDAEVSEAVYHEAIAPGAVHGKPTAHKQSNGGYQAHVNGMGTFSDHSDNIIEKEGKMEKIIEDKHIGKTSTLDLKAKKNVDKLTHHLATYVPADKSLFVGDSPKLIVVAEEDVISDNERGDLAPKKKRKKSSKNRKSSNVETEEAGDDLNVTKKRKKSNKSSKKKSSKIGLVPEEESTVKVKKSKRQKLEKLPESPQTLLSSETSIEKPSVIADDSETLKNKDVSARFSANHQDSLLDGLLRVL